MDIALRSCVFRKAKHLIFNQKALNSHTYTFPVYSWIFQFILCSLHKGIYHIIIRRLQIDHFNSVHDQSLSLLLNKVIESRFTISLWTSTVCEGMLEQTYEVQLMPFTDNAPYYIYTHKPFQGTKHWVLPKVFSISRNQNIKTKRYNEAYKYKYST